MKPGWLVSFFAGIAVSIGAAALAEQWCETDESIELWCGGGPAFDGPSADIVPIRMEILGAGPADVHVYGSRVVIEARRAIMARCITDPEED